MSISGALAASSRMGVARGVQRLSPIRHCHQRVRQVPVIVQVAERAARGRYDVDIRGVGRQQQNGCCQGGPALESDPAQKETGRGMSERIHEELRESHCMRKMGWFIPEPPIWICDSTSHYAESRNSSGTSRPKRSVSVAGLRRLSLCVVPPKYSLIG